MQSRYPLIIRLISIVLIASFLIQDVAWAHPDALQIDLRAHEEAIKPAFAKAYNDRVSVKASHDVPPANDSSPEKNSNMPEGRALNTRYFISIIPLGIISGLVFAVFTYYFKSDLNVAMSGLYGVMAAFLPSWLAEYIEDVVSLRRYERKDDSDEETKARRSGAPTREFKLISGLESAKDIRTIQDHDRNARGKIAYYSYKMQENLQLKAGDALYVDKEALRIWRTPKWIQAYIYLHDGILHGKLQISTEWVALPLTFLIPVFMAGLTVYLARFALFDIHTNDLYSLYLFIAYNILLPLLLKLASITIGTTKGPGGHARTTGSTIKHHMDAGDIDKAIIDTAHSRTKDIKTGRVTYWRDWLRGGDGSPTVEHLPCPEFIEDVIVVKSLYDPSSYPDSVNLEKAIRDAVAASFGRASLALIIADDGHSVLTPEERRSRVRGIIDEARRILKKRSYWSSFSKIDIRSTKYDITRLRGLADLYVRRLDRIGKGRVEPEAVASEVHGSVERLKRLLVAYKDGVIIFIGDYIGKTSNGLEAIYILRDHVKFGRRPKLAMLIGRTEHIFLRALFGDRTFAAWTQMNIYGGPEVMKSLDRLERESMEHILNPDPLIIGTSVDILAMKNAVRFRKVLENIISKRGEEPSDDNINKERARWYMFHPELLEAADFILEYMKPLYYEDKHHNLYMIPSIRPGFEWNGLRGLEAFDEIEKEFKVRAKSALRLRKMMSKIWMMINETGKDGKAGRTITKDDIDRITGLIDREIEINRGQKKALIPEDMLIRIKGMLAGVKDDIALDSESGASQRFDEILDNLMRAMNSIMGGLPEIFEVILNMAFQPSVKDGLMLASGETDRQASRLLLGINTIITPEDFSIEGREELKYARIFYRIGDLKLVEVDGMGTKHEASMSKMVLPARTQKGPKTDGETAGSMETVVSSKLKSVEKILNDYEGILTPSSKAAVRPGPAADIKTIDALSQYIDDLKKGLSAVSGDNKSYGLQLYRPLFRLLFERLKADFGETEEFIHYCRDIIRRDGSRELVRLMNSSDEDLMERFKLIRHTENTKDASISFYGLLLFNLCPDSAYWFRSLYNEFMLHNPPGEISLARKGISYHVRADSIVHFYDKAVIFGKSDSRYLKSLAARPDEKAPQMRMDSENNRKILKALRYWRDQSGYEHLKRRFDNFTGSTTVLEIDMVTPLLFSDAKHNVVRLIHAGRTRHVLYLPKPYLDMLDIDDDTDMKELAMWLIHGQRFIDLQEKLAEDKSGFEDTQKAISDLNNSFFNSSAKGGDDSGLVDLKILKIRLAGMMKENEMQRYGVLFGLAQSMSNKADNILAMADDSKHPGHYDKARELYGNILFRYEGLAMHSRAEKAYDNMRRATRGVQRYGGGDNAVAAQRDLIFIALRFGRWNDFVKELRVLLTGEGYPVEMPRDEAAMRRLLEPSDELGHGFREDLEHALAAQANAASPEMQLVVANAKREAERLLRDYYERESANTIRSNFTAAPVAGGEAVDMTAVGAEDLIRRGNEMMAASADELQKARTPAEEILDQIKSMGANDTVIYLDEHRKRLKELFMAIVIPFNDKEALLRIILSYIDTMPKYLSLDMPHRNVIYILSLFFSDDYLAACPLKITREQYDKLWKICDDLTFDNNEEHKFILRSITVALSDDRIGIIGPPDKKDAISTAEGRFNQFLDKVQASDENKEYANFNYYVVSPWVEFVRTAKGGFLKILSDKIKDSAASPLLRTRILRDILSPMCADVKEAKEAVLDLIKSRAEFNISRVETVNDAWNAIFENEKNARNFFMMASLLRKVYPYELTKDDVPLPLEYAMKEGIFFKLGPNLYMTPVTESFRRHIIFRSDDEGRHIDFAFEVLIPGERADKKGVGAEDRRRIAEEITSAFPDEDACVKPIFDKRFPNGEYEFYGGTEKFDDDLDLKVIAYEYEEDGKRLEYMSRAALQKAADESGLDIKVLERSIVARVAELTAMTHALGYVGHNYDGGSNFDHHTANFRFSRTGDSFKIKLVGDFESFEKSSKFSDLKKEINIDIGHIVSAPIIPTDKPLNVILSLSTDEIRSIFREHYEKFIAGHSYFAKIEESPPLKSNEYPDGLPIDTLPFGVGGMRTGEFERQHAEDVRNLKALLEKDPELRGLRMMALTKALNMAMPELFAGLETVEDELQKVLAMRLVAGYPMPGAPKNSKDKAKQAAERGMDIVFALSLAPVTLIAWSVFAPIIKLTSPGPVIFKQERVGIYGGRFTMYKFRSMYDGKVTWIGRIMRRFGIDELPQCWNILKGDMSLFGPRPVVGDQVSWDMVDSVFYRKPGFINLFSAITGPDKGRQPPELFTRLASYEGAHDSYFYRAKMIFAVFWSIILRAQMVARMRFLGLDNDTTIFVSLMLNNPEIIVNIRRSPGPFRVLVMCAQNRERSPLVEYMMTRNMPPDFKNKIEVMSRGIYDIQEDRDLEDKDFGIAGFVERNDALKSHMPLKVQGRDIEWADLIFVMTTAEKEALSRLYPSSRGKILKLIGDINVKIVSDDYSGSGDSYAALTGLIEGRLPEIFDRMRAFLKMPLPIKAPVSEKPVSPETQNLPIDGALSRQTAQAGRLPRREMRRLTPPNRASLGEDFDGNGLAMTEKGREIGLRQYRLAVSLFAERCGRMVFPNDTKVDAAVFAVCGSFAKGSPRLGIYPVQEKEKPEFVPESELSPSTVELIVRLNVHDARARSLAGILCKKLEEMVFDESGIHIKSILMDEGQIDRYAEPFIKVEDFLNDGQNYAAAQLPRKPISMVCLKYKDAKSGRTWRAKDGRLLDVDRNNIEEIKRQIKNDSFYVSVNGKNFYFENKLVSEFAAMGLARDAFRDSVTGYIEEHYRTSPPLFADEVFVAMLESSESMFGNGVADGLVCVDVRLFKEKFPEGLILKLFHAGLRHELSHEGLESEKAVLKKRAAGILRGVRDETITCEDVDNYMLTPEGRHYLGRVIIIRHLGYNIERRMFRTRDRDLLNLNGKERMLLKSIITDESLIFKDFPRDSGMNNYDKALGVLDLAGKGYKYGVRVMSRNRPLCGSILSALPVKCFTRGERDRLAYNLASMKTGSLEILRITGVLSERAFTAIKAEDAEAFANMSPAEKKDFRRRIGALVSRYNRECTPLQKKWLLKRLIPYDVIRALAYMANCSPSSMIDVMYEQADLPDWLTLAIRKADDLEKRLRTSRGNIWRALLKYGADGAEPYLQSRAGAAPNGAVRTSRWAGYRPLITITGEQLFLEGGRGSGAYRCLYTAARMFYNRQALSPDTVSCIKIDVDNSYGESRCMYDQASKTMSFLLSKKPVSLRGAMMALKRLAPVPGKKGGPGTMYRGEVEYLDGSNPYALTSRTTEDEILDAPVLHSDHQKLTALLAEITEETEALKKDVFYYASFANVSPRHEAISISLRSISANAVECARLLEKYDISHEELKFIEAQFRRIYAIVKLAGVKIDREYMNKGLSDLFGAALKAVKDAIICVNGKMEVYALIESIHNLAAKGFENRARENTKILISEKLLSESDRKHLAGLLGKDSMVRILSPRDVKKEVYAKPNSSRKTVGCIISKEEYNDPDLWHGKGEEKASLLILNEDLQGERYMYLEGVAGLVMAMMNGDEQAMASLMSRIFNPVDGMKYDELAKLLVSNPKEFIEHIRLKRIEAFKDGEIPDKYKLEMENYLIKA